MFKGSSEDLGLGDLEVNKKFEESQNEDKPLEDKPLEDKPLDDKPLGEENKPLDDKPLDDKPLEDKQIEDKPLEEEKVVTEVTEEAHLKFLSEKLGREINSFEDLTPSETALDNDPYLKGLYEWRQKTGRPIEDYAKYQVDYDTMEDIDIAREALRLEYPTFSPKEIQEELAQFMPSDEDYDNEAAKKARELKKYVTKGKVALNSLKSELGEASSDLFSPEVKQKITFADEVSAKILSNQAQQKEHNSSVRAAAGSLESVSLSLTDDLSIDFKIAEADRSKIADNLVNATNLKNEDGTWNNQAIAESGAKLEYFSDMIKLAFEQGKNSGADGIIKDAKNTTLGDNISKGGNQDGGGKKGSIEGIDSILNRKTPKIRFGS